MSTNPYNTRQKSEQKEIFPIEYPSHPDLADIKPHFNTTPKTLDNNYLMFQMFLAQRASSLKIPTFLPPEPILPWLKRFTITMTANGILDKNIWQNVITNFLPEKISFWLFGQKAENRATWDDICNTL